ncbi:serine/threonine protein kinase [Microbacterium sp. CnD16-F]|uniref:serine/threonine protein kinase n=1 Tax=Microbacterium sp. CnD16-F TaxID=2954493 RepID=UPI002097276F|nr:serine/threonine-protein kinase [Microbacterium sp. CnD16-F]MCO7202148.1 serine/threonine protein kinase [Microbacterium sp. CnD16-F]
MTVADDALVGEAITELGLTDEGPIGAAGGQKAVRRVSRNGTSCVLKVVALEFTTDETLKRAEREVQLLASIDNPNVVKVESDLVELGTPVRGAAWIEEYLDGDDLGNLLTGSPWSWDGAKSMGVQVANGLAAGHEKSVIHRDLSANNVRRLSDGTYKVLDFGFARHTLRSGLTVAGQPGTPGFLTPEHLNSYSGGPMKMSDVFQVGILLYTALSGVSPYPWTGDEFDYVSRLQNGTMKPLREHRSDLRPDQLEIVQRALHPQPARVKSRGVV